MAKNRKSVKLLRCPWCFRKGNDSSEMVYDARSGEYYCLKCCFSGTEKTVRFEYRQFQSKYRWMTRRLDLLKELKRG